MADKKLAGTKVLMIIAPEQFRDEELLEPQRILSEQGAHVTVASTKPGEAEGMLGAKVRPDTTIDTIKPADYHAVVVIGGMGSPEYLWNNPTLHDILKQCHQNNKVVAAICLSGAVLANAGVLAGKRATVYATPESLEALESGKANYVKEHVVADGNVITADGPEAAPEFADEIATALQKVVAKV
jgi:protease I